MANPENEAAAPPADAKPKKKGKSKLLLIGVPVFMLLMGGGAGAWWYFNQPAPEGEGAEAEHAAEAEEEAGGLLALEAFVVNLSDVGSRKYLRVKIALLLPDEAVAKEVEENKLAISRLRSSIIEVLTVRTSTDLSTAEGRAALRHAVGEAAKNVAHMEVKDVLFEDFIVQ